jgi:hypothetical protein
MVWRAGVLAISTLGEDAGAALLEATVAGATVEDLTLVFFLEVAELAN